VESLRTYLRHRLGLTPGQTQVASSMGLTAHKLSVGPGTETRAFGIERLPVIWYLREKQAAKMNMAAASSKLLPDNCKPRAAAQGSKCKTQAKRARLQRYGGCCVTAGRGGGEAARATKVHALCSAAPDQAAPPPSSATTGRPRSHCHVLTADYPWGASASHSAPAGWARLHVRISF